MRTGPTVMLNDMMTRALRDDSTLVVFDAKELKEAERRSRETWQRICDAIKFNTNIRELLLRDCSIDDMGAVVLSEGLAQNNRIVHADLQYNNIGDAGASAIVC
ncbi:hypothetical protein GUITHDRAFT_114857 [Guillardia theta CCMP2712]|uniref:Uncharacterized protein n=1 Tax=Guillardia theta (strain CCMP2712) TaxID=905079 RepID=L1ISA7_GUITC|nr:hypothetical protein GUITHDRAFT_114857 [Guillardia theta CCMP2712]EKX38977.1 hypothetical protein GUITHDRAFT_114857 [Guillardia theta CCMP2712]|eukprot:XP_005825957.1 hypothetical protein GUITHDRAFT_114857 [Guillardia theta CCMP2712]